MKNLSLLFVALLIGALFVDAKPLNGKRVEWATDCGAAGPSRSSQGFTYEADTGFDSKSKVSDYSTSQDTQSVTIKYTNDPSVYFTERHADGSFEYEIPIRNPGKYVLIFKFCEMWFYQKGKRVFNIKFGDQRVAENIDIFANVGRFAAYDEYVEFELKNNQIFFKGRAIPGAFNDRKGVLRVELEKGLADNPKVDGIVLYQGELADTDYADIPKMRADWEKRAAAEAKKKEDERLRKEEARLKQRERVKVRNDHYDEFEEEEYEDVGEEYDPNSGVFNKIAASSGLIFFVVLLSAGLYFFVIKPTAGPQLHAPAVSAAEKELLAEESAAKGDKKAKTEVKKKK